jgi:hypothetical protein
VVKGEEEDIDEEMDDSEFVPPPKNNRGKKPAEPKKRARDAMSGANVKAPAGKHLSF